MSDICKICETIENGGFYELKDHRENISLGMFGEGEGSVWVCANKPGKVTFNFAVKGDGGPIFNVIDVPITYCPFCGKDFSKIIFKEDEA